MAKSREISMNLPSVDDLFTTQEERDQKNQEYVKDIPCMTAGSKQHKATAGVPDGRLF